eukprot:SAG11_NODE_922_length_6540_cov_45.267816_2_plen_141_part_00
MAGSNFISQAYPDLTIHKAKKLPPDEIVEATGQKWNPWTHTLNIEESTAKGYAVYDLRTVRINGQTLPCQAFANSKGGMTPDAYRFYITNCIVPQKFTSERAQLFGQERADQTMGVAEPRAASAVRPAGPAHCGRRLLSC